MGYDIYNFQTGCVLILTSKAASDETWDVTATSSQVIELRFVPHFVIFAALYII